MPNAANATTDRAQAVLLTAKEVADVLRLSESGVRKLAAKGELPAVRIGGSLRFNRIVVDDLIASSTATPNGSVRCP